MNFKIPGALVLRENFPLSMAFFSFPVSCLRAFTDLTYIFVAMRFLKKLLSAIYGFCQ